jgi:hypothetical protein
MQGSQPSPKKTPSTGAMARPTVGTAWMRTSRWSSGTRPMNTRPSRITSTPVTIDSSRWYAKSSWPIEPNSAPPLTNTAVKPRTNSDDPSSSRPRRAVSRSWTPTPVTYDR